MGGLGKLLGQSIKETSAERAKHMRCPKCGSRMRFASDNEANARYSYNCSNYPKCDVMTFADELGNPTSKPADLETRNMRFQVSRSMDAIWAGYKGNKAEVRRILCRWLGARLSIKDFDVGKLDSEGCRKAIEACRGSTIDTILAEMRAKNQRMLEPLERLVEQSQKNETTESRMTPEEEAEARRKMLYVKGFIVPEDH